jgi:alpha-tubulin suppressor-like RCC1 family protein
VGGVIAAAAIACSDQTAPTAPPAAVVKVAGDSQSSVVGSALPGPLSVRVTDAHGKFLSGVTVTFAVTAGSGAFDHATAATGSDGVASAHWVVGDTAGPNGASATVSGLPPVPFVATGLAGSAAKIVVMSGDTVGGTVGQSLDSAVAVKVTDLFGNAIAGRSVTFAVLSGGGNIGTSTTTTNVAGTATTTWMLGGTEGIQSLQVSSPSLPTLQVAAIAFPPLPAQRLTVGRGDGCWLTLNGTAFCWGQNFDGQLGNGTHVRQYQPVPVAGGRTYVAISTVSAIGTGLYSTCGIASDSVAYCWGSNSHVSSSVPVPVAGAPKLVSVTVGEDFACGLTPSGTAYCWGNNSLGQLGDGTLIGQNIPAPIAGSLRFRQLSAGVSHTCGISWLGQMYCWGYDPYVLPTADPLPKPIVATARFASLIVDGYHSCMIALGGDLYCWGANLRNEVTAQPGGPGYLPVPTLVSTGHSFVKFGLGFETTCGLEADGSAYCWGRNNEYSVGDTILTGGATPGLVQGGLHFAVVEGGGVATCGITLAETLHCWGSNFGGALGIPDSSQQFTPVPVAGGLTFTSISAGNWHSCGLTAQGLAYCWGENAQFSLVGDGTLIQRSLPTAVAGGHHFASLSADGYDTCGIDLQGAAWCWGYAGYGVLGTGGGVIDSPIPVPVAGGLVFSSIDVGLAHACGLVATGEAWCWGSGFGPAGHFYGLPVKVTSPEAFTEVSVNNQLPCGLGASGVAYCWSPRSDSISEVASIVPGGLHFTHISAGNISTCGLIASGDAYCWAPVPFGTGLPTLVPGGLAFARLEQGSDGTFCGVTVSGAAYCWGRNTSGQVGDGDTNPAPNPTPVAGGLSFVTVTPSYTHTCGLTTAGAGYCWGTGPRGMLGTGATIYHPIPVRIQ